MDDLRSKTLVMLIGPTAIGKSTLMNAVERLDDNFKRVGGFTTREPRTNDEPGQYRYYSKQEVLEKAKNGEMLQFAEFPTTGHIYGTETADYHATYNLKDVLTNAVDEFRAMPFARTIAVSLTTDPGVWEDWFMERYGSLTEDAVKRLRQAKSSVEWSLAQYTDHIWLVNEPELIESSAKTIIDIVSMNDYSTSVPDQAPQLLQTIERLLSYE